MRFLLILTLLLSSTANAYVMVGGWSKHFHDKGQNETHDLMAVEYDSVIAGTFVNSYGDRSYVAGYDFSGYWKGLEYGAIVGGVIGYPQSDLLPAVVPYVTIKDWNVKPAIGLLGKAVFLSFKIDY